MHLIIDGYGGDAETLQNTELIYNFLDTLPDRIGMTKMIPPQVYTYHGEKSQDWGVSGFVLIAESHISVHTFPDRQHVNIDVFSCKSFDTDKCVKIVESCFGLARAETNILERGLEYMNDHEAYSGMVRERVSLITPANTGDVRL
ncbi:MAG: S-adenosylmethionine decarboxylase [Chloroflexi bacterium]|nr:S-adenosylmethionine decarboxylase [Chloroflexota bacterium]